MVLSIVKIIIIIIKAGEHFLADKLKKAYIDMRVKMYKVFANIKFKIYIMLKTT